MPAPGGLGKQKRFCLALASLAVFSVTASAGALYVPASPHPVSILHSPNSGRLVWLPRVFAVKESNRKPSASAGPVGLTRWFGGEFRGGQTYL